MRKPLVAAALGAVTALAAPRGLADHTPFGAVEPTGDEQAGIYAINRARNDPAAYGLEVGIDLSMVPARPPLAVNRNLTGSARFHAAVMFDHHEYGHVSTLLGIGPNQMAVNNGYDLFGNGLGFNWGTTNSIESILRSVNQISTTTGAVKAFIIDKDVPGAGHRVHLLAIGAYGDHREIGFGWASGKDTFPEFGLPKLLPTRLGSIQTGFVDTGVPFVTGVVFRDANRNRKFDAGEGLGGVNVDFGGGPSVLTMASGGWSAAVAPGTYFVTCSGGDFPGTSLARVFVGSDNRELDFHAGRAAGEVDFAWRDGIPAGPDVQAQATPVVGTAPLDVDFIGFPGTLDFYNWDFANGSTGTGETPNTTFTEAGLFPVIVTGLSGGSADRGLVLVAVTDPSFPAEGLTAPVDGALHLVKGSVKRTFGAVGKDQAVLSGTLELPGGFAPLGRQIHVCVAGALRTFTLDAKGKGTLPDGSKVSLKAKWPKLGEGVLPGTIAKITATLKGDLSIPLEAAGLRDLTEERGVFNVPAAVHFAGRPWTALGTLSTKSTEGKTGKGTLAPPE
jgi:hypothetical protein